MKKFNRLIIAIVIILIIIDQLSKIIMINLGEIIIIQNVFSLNVTELQTDTSLATLVLEHIIIIAIMIKFMAKDNQFIDKKLRVFLSLVLSGGISNLIDLLFRKHVVNFINVRYLPVLNIAYICIIIGIILVVGNFAIFTSKEMRNRKSGKIHS